MTIIQVLYLILLTIDFRSLALAQSSNRAIYPDCQCAFLLSNRLRRELFSNNHVIVGC